MAKKVINVVYKVDDSALSKTKVTIQQLAAETKKTEQAMQAAGNAAKKAGDQAKDTYTIQKVQLENLRAKIDQTSQSDTARMNKLKSEYLVLKKSVDDFNKSLQESKPAADSAATSFLSLDRIIKAAFSVAAVKQIVSMTLEMAKLSGEVKGVEIGFKRAFGATSSVLLEQLKKSTHGVVTEFELMKQAVQAKNLGIPVEHLGVLLEFAATRAQQTGQSVDYLVDSIQKGIGRKSILFFDQLGISTTRLKEEMGGVAIKSQEVGDVAAAVARVAGEELKKMGGYVETSATKVDQLSVSWNKLKQTTANTLTSPGLLSFYDRFLKALTQSVQGKADREAELKAGAAASVADFLGNAKKTNQAIQEEIFQRVKNITVLKDEKKAIEERAKTMDTTGVDVTKQTEEKIMVEQEAIRLLYAQIEAQSKVIPLIKEETEEVEKNTKAQDEAAEARGKNFQTVIDLAVQQKEIEKRNAQEFNKQILDEDAQAAKDMADQQNKNLNEFYENKKEKRDKDLNDQRIAADYEKQVIQAVYDFGINALQQTLYATLLNRETDQQDLEAKYQAELDAAGNNEQAKKKIQKKIDMDRDQQRAIQAQKDKDDAITKIEIDTLIAVAKTFAEYGYPAGIPFAALMAAAGGIAIATIKSVKSSSLQTRAFKDGEVDIDGPGTSTSDSISAKLSKGESVINASATKASRNLLEAINERKIDDRILSRLAGDGGRQAPIFDDSRIVKAINANKVNLAVEGNTLMEYRQVTSNFKRRVRAKVGV